MIPKSTIAWTPIEHAEPKRDVPVLAIVDERDRRFCTVTHRMMRGWAGLKYPARVSFWSNLPQPPQSVDHE